MPTFCYLDSSRLNLGRWGGHSSFPPEDKLSHHLAPPPLALSTEGKKVASDELAAKLKKEQKRKRRLQQEIRLEEEIKQMVVRSRACVAAYVR